MTASNRRFLLAKRPQGEVRRDDFTFETVTVAEPDEGQVVVRNLYLSLDPAMRGWMNEGKSYVPPVGLGEVMRALGVGEVTASRHPDVKVGDTVSGVLGMQDYYVGDAKGLQPIDPSLAPLPRYLSALGMTGMTAYFALLEVGQPKAGDTVVISGAAGAVGSIAGQIAKLKGCRVIGIAGGQEKGAYLKTLGFDGVIDYKAEDVKAGLERECPKGVDVYFDNVGGDILDAVLARLNFKARVVICGAISQYNSQDGVKGPANYLALLVNRARMEGFIVTDHLSEYPKAAREMAGWLDSGEVKSKEHVVEGLETFPDTLQKLFKGENFGKLVLKV
ncbi:NADP-dependent oxidoreductase [Pseudomonas entomophila]|uniref:NADP-dependent oxidoreductase n=1 Tax=Pseudomonas entomophila TaxID=312306 RepID=UPI0015E31B2D|nr:NADP-dependent oxidoreductase [Pseudomonas entomophila]MBA1193950.1 NADP-dependent oxidoreductase [Pseudomonas entomophila]